MTHAEHDPDGLHTLRHASAASTESFSALETVVPETIVGELADQPASTLRSGPTGLIDHIYDFHPGRVAVRIDGPDVMAVACDDHVGFTAAHLVTPERAVKLERSVGMFVGTHDETSVFRLVFESADEAKRYSTGWIQRRPRQG